MDPQQSNNAKKDSIRPQKKGVPPISQFGKPWRILHAGIKLVPVQHQKDLPVRGNMDGFPGEADGTKTSMSRVQYRDHPVRHGIMVPLNIKDLCS
jgi:hypothetical protein